MVTYELPNLDKLLPALSNSFSPEDEYILRQLNASFTQKQNLHGRRIGKAKDAINPGDYVTKRQINGNLFGTLAQRPQPSNVAPGTTYFASDRNVTYQMRNGHWYYKDGIQFVTLSPDTKPSPSILYDFGYQIWTTDFRWGYYWNLTRWIRIGTGTGYVQGFELAPTEPGWGLCDGTNYAVSKDDGTLGTLGTQNLIGTARFLKFGSTYTTLAAVTPTISGNTGSSGSHNHTVIANGSVSGNLPNHKHTLLDSLIDSGHANMSNAVFLDGTAWSVAGTITGYSPTDVPSAQFTACTTIPDTLAATGSHNHNNPTPDFNDTSEDHFHLLTGTTEDPTTNPSLSLTFTGSSATTSSDGSHTHTGSSLTISSDGVPIAIQLIPYIRL